MTTPEPFYIRFGQRVQRYRVARKLTQEQLGRLLVPAMTRASVANIENAKQRVLAHTVAQLARGLLVTEAQLFGKARPMSEVCPDCGRPQNPARHIAELDGATLGGTCGAHLHPAWAEECSVRMVVLLRGQLAQSQRENAAWRALAELQDGRYDVAFPARRTLGDFGCSVADRTKREPDGIGGTQVVRVYGEGPTSGASAVDLATKAGLLPEPQKASG